MFALKFSRGLMFSLCSLIFSLRQLGHAVLTTRGIWVQLCNCTVIVCKSVSDVKMSMSSLLEKKKKKKNHSLSPKITVIQYD